MLMRNDLEATGRYCGCMHVAALEHWPMFGPARRSWCRRTVRQTIKPSKEVLVFMHLLAVGRIATTLLPGPCG